MRVLLVEQDAAMVRVLERGLRAHGFEVSSVEPAAASATLAADASLGILLVDAAPGATTTRALVKRMRTSRPTLPLLFLVTRNSPTGTLTDDEYLVKPFAMEELIARIHARTRAASEPRVTTLIAGDLRLDLLARCAWRGERLIELAGREFALLEYFMRHPRRVLQREAILADVWGYHMHQNASSSNVVDVYVRYLRNRLHAPGETPVIATLRGEGYQFNPPVDQPAPHLPRRRA